MKMMVCCLIMRLHFKSKVNLFLMLDILMIKQEFHDIENDRFDQDFIPAPIVPDQDQFEQWMVEKKRKELVEKYLE
jgi:hypothetical protein